MPAEAKNRFRPASPDRIPILSVIGGKSVPPADPGVIRPDRRTIILFVAALACHLA
jgi:hypothetical protein